jgi:hypothetical protein
MQLLWGRDEVEMRLGGPGNCGYNRQNRYRLTPGFVGESLRDSHGMWALNSNVRASARTNTFLSIRVSERRGHTCNIGRRSIGCNAQKKGDEEDSADEATW